MSEPRDILDLVFEREHLNIVVIGPGPTTPTTVPAEAP